MYYCVAFKLFGLTFIDLRFYGPVNISVMCRCYPWIHGSSTWQDACNIHPCHEFNRSSYAAEVPWSPPVFRRPQCDPALTFMASCILCLGMKIPYHPWAASVQWGPRNRLRQTTWRKTLTPQRWIFHTGQMRFWNYTVWFMLKRYHDPWYLADRTEQTHPDHTEAIWSGSTLFAILSKPQCSIKGHLQQCFQVSNILGFYGRIQRAR